MVSRGFKQSLIDPCLFIRSNCIVIVYVDDCLLFAKTDSILDSLISSIQSEFNLTTQGDIDVFLRVDIKCNADGYLELFQPGLINKVISFCGFENESNQHKTPFTNILHADPDGPDREHTWNYHVIIGMLTCLSTSIHPDIAFAVHQCACFSVAPKRSHEIAV